MNAECHLEEGTILYFQVPTPVPATVEMVYRKCWREPLIRLKLQWERQTEETVQYRLVSRETEDDDD